MGLFRKQRGPVERHGDQFVLAISADERALLSRLLGELGELLSTNDDADSLRRLHPPAYHLDADREAGEEYRRLMTEELVASRLTAIATVREALNGSAQFDADGFDAFLRSLNSVRLVLGTMLDVSEDDDLVIDDSAPLAAERHLYHYLSWLLDASIESL